MGFLEIWSMKTLFMTTKKMLGDPFFAIYLRTGLRSKEYRQNFAKLSWQKDDNATNRNMGKTSSLSNCRVLDD